MICEACVTKHEFLLYYDDSCIKKSQVTEEDNPENVDHLNQDEESDEKEDIGYCKKPKEKSEKLCAKFWSDVCRVSLFLIIFFNLNFRTIYVIHHIMKVILWHFVASA